MTMSIAILEFINAIDPVDDFQEVSLLCHAVCSGSIDAIKLLLERGALVKRNSGKLLTLAVVMNRRGSGETPDRTRHAT